MAKMSDNADRVWVALVTVPHEEAGKRLARGMVDEQLAACGNVIPGLTSVYRWGDGVQEDPEALVIFKTTEAVLGRLRARVVEEHSYEVPEFLAFPVQDGHSGYLEWVQRSVRESKKEP
jgi:periplasmic divalent cation tolerance protein